MKFSLSALILSSLLTSSLAHPLHGPSLLRRQNETDGLLANSTDTPVANSTEFISQPPPSQEIFTALNDTTSGNSTDEISSSNFTLPDNSTEISNSSNSSQVSNSSDSSESGNEGQSSSESTSLDLGGRSFGSTGRGGKRKYRNNDRKRNNGDTLVFIQSNDRDDNQLIIIVLSSTGDFTLLEIVSTGGRGGFLDGLDRSYDSSGGGNSVLVVDNHVFVVNSGSNSITVFEIDYDNLTVVIIQEIHSGGEFAVSLSHSRKNNLICVLNGGRINTVACFDIEERGRMRPRRNGQKNLNIVEIGQSPPRGGWDDVRVSDISFSEDEAFLIVACKGGRNNNGNDGWLGSFQISENGLSDDFVRSSPDRNQGGGSITSITIIEGSSKVFSSDSNIGITIIDFSSGGFSQSGVSSSFSIPDQKYSGKSVRSKRSGTFFISDSGGDFISEYDVEFGGMKSRNNYRRGTAPTDLVIIDLEQVDILIALGGGSSTLEILIIFDNGNNRRGRSYDFRGEALAIGVDIGRTFTGLTVVQLDN